VCSHTPTLHTTTISRDPYNFSDVAPHFLSVHDSPSNLAESRYPRLVIQTGSWTGVCKVSRLCHWYCKVSRLCHWYWNSGCCRFCQYQYTIIVTICVCVCVCIERGKERRERGGESQCHNYSDGVSESINKRQEKTLKVMCFIDSKINHSKRIFLTSSQ